MPVSNPIIRGEGELVLWTQHQVASEGAGLGWTLCLEMSEATNRTKTRDEIEAKLPHIFHQTTQVICQRLMGSSQLG